MLKDKDITDVLKKISIRSGGVLDLLLVKTKANLSNLPVGALADVYIGKDNELSYRAYLVMDVNESISSVKQAQKLMNDNKKKVSIIQSKYIFSAKFYGVIIAESITIDAKTCLKEHNYPFIDMRSGEKNICLPSFYYFEQPSRSKESSHNSLESIVSAKNSKSHLILRELCQERLNHEWTIKELSDRTGIAKSVVHKLKNRLLNIGIVEPCNSTAKKTRFHLTKTGETEINDAVS